MLIYKSRINRENLILLLSTIGMFTLFSIPSLKLLYSSIIFNLLPLLLLFYAALMKRKFYLSKERRILLFLWTLFSAIFFIGFFNGGYFDSFNDLFENIYFILVVYLSILLSNLRVLTNVFFLVFLWGLFLAIWHLTIGVQYGEGQHYLTLSMPLGAALSYSLRFFFITNDNFKKKLFYFISFMFIFFALTTLLSRSVFIFTILIFLIFFITYLFMSKDIKVLNKIIIWVVFGAFATIVTYYLADYVNFSQGYRYVQLLEETSSEPRAISYIRDINSIINNPIIGYGVNSYLTITGEIYPHNIFLEILFSGGIILLIPFLYILILYLKTSYKALRNDFVNSNIFGAIAVSLFYFLQFNTSFPLRSGYIPIGAMVLLIIGYREFTQIKRKQQHD